MKKKGLWEGLRAEDESIVEERVRGAGYPYECYEVCACFGWRGKREMPLVQKMICYYHCFFFSNDATLAWGQGLELYHR